MHTQQNSSAQLTHSLLPQNRAYVPAVDGYVAYEPASASVFTDVYFVVHELNFDLSSVHKLEKYVLEFHAAEKRRVMSGDWVIFKMSEKRIGLARFVPRQQQVFNHG